MEINHNASVISDTYSCYNKKLFLRIRKLSYQSHTKTRVKSLKMTQLHRRVVPEISVRVSWNPHQGNISNFNFLGKLTLFELPIIQCSVKLTKFRRFWNLLEYTPIRHGMRGTWTSHISRKFQNFLHGSQTRYSEGRGSTSRSSRNFRQKIDILKHLAKDTFLLKKK